MSLVGRRLWLLSGLFALTCYGPMAWSHDISDLKRALADTGKHHLEISVGAADFRTIVPATVATGKQPGPTLLILAGIHGSEYAPILASQRFGQSLDPDDLSGAVVIIHMANLPAYLGRTIYTSPADGLNLNRLFPGKATGSLSERLAYALSQEIYPLADAVLDVHSGDGNEDLRPYWTGYYAQAGDPDVIEKSKAMAIAFGLEHIVPFQWQLTDPADAIWAGSAAVAQGIPSIDVEAGGMGIVDQQAVQQLETGFMRILAHLGMIDAAFPAPTAQRIIYARESIRSPVDGSWVSLKAAGERVRADELLGYVTDFHGRRVFSARAPKEGLVMLRLSAPPVRKGETLVTVAATKPLE